MTFQNETSEPAAKTPTVGLIGSVAVGSDRYTIEITEVSKSGKTIKFRQARRGGRLSDREDTARLTSGGGWKVTYSSSRVYLDGPCDHRDPSF